MLSTEIVLRSQAVIEVPSQFQKYIFILFA